MDVREAAAELWVLWHVYGLDLPATSKLAIADPQTAATIRVMWERLDTISFAMPPALSYAERVAWATIMGV